MKPRQATAAACIAMDQEHSPLPSAPAMTDASAAIAPEPCRPLALSVEGICKCYRIYRSNLDRLKEAFHPLRRSYHRNFHALDNISFTVAQGECLGIIGRNGAGKSTLLKILTGVSTPTSGRTCIAGRVAALLELGAGFNPELTGLENVYFNGAILGFTKQEITAQLDSILAFADIGDFIHQPVKTYSSGMFVRLAFAVAIQVDPDILIVDEALAVGDARFQLKCHLAIDKFRERGRTILLVSHDLGAITHICDRALLLENGQLLAEGPPNEVTNIYSRLVAEGGGYECVRDDIAALRTHHAASLAAGSRDDAGPAVCLTRVSQVEDARTRALRLDEQAHTQISECEYRYGGEDGTIETVFMTDTAFSPCATFTSGDECRVVMQCRAKKEIIDPIYALTIKDIRGQEIYGTNTYFSHQPAPLASPGGRYEIIFVFPLNIMPGEYFISLGWTYFVDMDLRVVERRYDAIKFTVTPHDRTFGIANCYATISVTSCE